MPVPHGADLRIASRNTLGLASKGYAFAILVVVLAYPSTMTDFTESLVGIDAYILAGKRVTVLAESFHDAIQSASLIFGYGNRLKVVWSDARWVPTQMIDGEAVRNWTNEEFVGHSMNKTCSAATATYVNAAIALPVETTGPNPAEIGLSDVSHEAFSHGYLSHGYDGSMSCRGLSSDKYDRWIV